MNFEHATIESKKSDQKKTPKVRICKYTVTRSRLLVARGWKGRGMGSD
jgi:hypothetical protein